MIPLLKPLLDSIWLKTALAIFSLSILSILFYIVFEDYLKQNLLIGLLGIMLFTLLLSLLLAKSIADFAIKPTDFLVRAVLLVTNPDNNVEPPNIKNLNTASGEFLAETITKIYGFNAGKTTSAENNAEAQYFKTLADLFPLPIIALNTNKEIGYLNKAAADYLEVSREQSIGQPLYDVFNISFNSADTLEDWWKDIAQDSVTASETWQRVRLNLKDNNNKKFDLVANYSQNNSNGIELILAIYDRTMLYERDDKDLTFVALAVHELRTPVTILRGYIEVFEDELSAKLDNEQKEFMHNMSSSAQRLTSFVSNILNVARIEENSLNVNLKEEDWAEVVNQICKDMELQAKVRGKKLVTKVADNLPKVAVDRITIYEVMANIIENAIKYTHTDEEIIIDAHLKDGLVETTVTDKGVGIPSSIINHVFDKFYRSYSSKNSIGGTGLGLYLAKALIEAHGGSIWVKSKEGKGSTFGFTVLPYSNLADELKNNQSGEIVRGAHGWIKNHSLYRG